VTFGFLGLPPSERDGCGSVISLPVSLVVSLVVGTDLFWCLSVWAGRHVAIRPSRRVTALVAFPATEGDAYLEA
jgi:hypothetical protein